MEAAVNGIRMAYQANGEPGKPALLLVHGFPLDSGMWEAQLAGLGGQAFVIAPDLRGHGKSDTPDGGYSIDQHAEDLVALLDLLNVRRAVVAGFSMGGYVTLALWRRHSDRVAGLALVDSRAGADTPEGRAGRNATIERVRERGVGVLAEEMLPKLLAPENLKDERIAGRLQEIILRQPAEGMIGALTAMRDREDSASLLPGITAPTAVIVGEHDTITPPDLAATMAKQIPEARAVVIVNAGHASPLENPEEVNMALGELLSIAQF